MFDDDYVITANCNAHVVEEKNHQQLGCHQPKFDKNQTHNRTNRLTQNTPSKQTTTQTMSGRKPAGAQASKLGKKVPPRPTTHLAPTNQIGSASNPLANSNSFSSSLHNKAVTGPSNLQRDQAGRIVEFFVRIMHRSDLLIRARAVSNLWTNLKEGEFRAPDFRKLGSREGSGYP
ncbi:TFIIH/NER complex subunit [Puccinia graminis f. sp. tritici]|uniref:TFIIH/NER complex subunit n=1 Tax=Puccinia graminis f. sp. tritici TaxID=56615 RepID=A0A5B0PLQ4_PUCGR|nr:TFIIH/NER complex subunit [Puccinia graminis f. sp. tritici]